MNKKIHTHDAFLVGLKDACALEKKALSVVRSQVSRLTHDPELSQN